MHWQRCYSSALKMAPFTPLYGETAMPFYEKGDVCIHYEETGSASRCYSSPAVV